jgi:hypothetical protein
MVTLMTLDEALEEDNMVSRSEAKAECERHSLDFADLVDELGDHPEYQSCDVLHWLGY